MSIDHRHPSSLVASAALVVGFLAGSSVRAQAPPQLPYEKGQWTGPYEYNFKGDPPPNDPGGEKVFAATAEIAHAVVLPPPDGNPDLTRILFWNGSSRRMEGAAPFPWASPTASPTTRPGSTAGSSC